MASRSSPPPARTGEAWRLKAVRADGNERWQAEHGDYNQAVYLLAECIGFDLRDG
jgi:hypothetical protein